MWRCHILLLRIKVPQSKITSFEAKKKYLSQILKVIRQVDKYDNLYRCSPKDGTIMVKIKDKLSVFETATRKLLGKRNQFQYQQLDRFRSPNPKKDLSIGFNSTKQDISEIHPYNLYHGKHELSHQQKGVMDQSEIGSLSKLLESLKTGDKSRFSEKQMMNTLRLNELVNNSVLVDEKLAELQNKLDKLRKVVF